MAIHLLPTVFDPILSIQQLVQYINFKAKHEIDILLFFGATKKARKLLQTIISIQIKHKMKKNLCEWESSYRCCFFSYFISLLTQKL